MRVHFVPFLRWYKYWLWIKRTALEFGSIGRRKQVIIHLDENESEFLIDWLHEDLLLEKESDIADSMVVKTLESIVNKLKKD